MTAGETVYSRFARTARRWPGRPFLNVLAETAQAYSIAPGQRTYQSVMAEIDVATAAYRKAGYQPGHRVGLLLENRPAFFVHWLALNGLGMSVVPINPDLRRAELEFLVAHSGIAGAIAADGLAARLTEAAPDLPVFGPSDIQAPARNPAPVHADAECALLYTSGTTGRPKGCVLTNSYFLHCAQWYAQTSGAIALHDDPQERMLTPLPLFHVNALAFSAMAMIQTGGCLTVLDRFHPKTWWTSVRDAKATAIHYLGIMPPVLMAQPPTPAERDHQVRFGFGAGIDPALHEACEDRFGFPFVEGWAMTETGAGGVIMANHAPRPVGKGSFGRPRAGVAVRIVTEEGRDADPDEPGELLVRREGPDPRRFFFREYLDDPKATDAAWEGGWLHTGDIVARTKDGDYRFIDRKKNIVRRSGENISAAEVESILGRHPAIAGVAIAPVPDDLRGEEVLALVVRSDESQGSVEAAAAGISAWCRERIAYYKVPGWIAFVDALPVTASAKLQRGEIRALAGQVMATGRAIDLRHLKKRAA